MAWPRLVSPVGVALLILLGLLSLFLVQIIRLGLSDVIAQGARYDAEHSVVIHSEMGDAAQDAIQADFRKALALTPNDPQLYEDLGKFYDQRGLHAESDRSATAAFRQQSLAYYRQAALARPTSAMAALAVALLKIKLGERDKEFSFFLGRAFENGPWEPGVQLLSIRLGLTAWAELPDRQRQQVRVAVDQQLSWTQLNQRAAILDLLKEFRREDLRQQP